MPRAVSRLQALLFVTIPLACAVGVDPEIAGDPTDTAGTAGTTMSTGGATGGTGVVPKAGSSSTAGKGPNPSGGSAGAGSSGAGSGGAGTGGSNGGAAGTGTAGTAQGGTSAGTSSGGASGSGTGGSGGAGGTGSGCECPMPLVWMDNTVMNWGSGDCLSVAGKNFLYVGSKAQTYANKQCNPTAQEPWCTDMGNDYKFTACP